MSVNIIWLLLAVFLMVDALILLKSSGVKKVRAIFELIFTVIILILCILVYGTN